MSYETGQSLHFVCSARQLLVTTSCHEQMPQKALANAMLTDAASTRFVRQNKGLPFVNYHISGFLLSIKILTHHDTSIWLVLCYCCCCFVSGNKFCCNSFGVELQIFQVLSPGCWYWKPQLHTLLDVQAEISRQLPAALRTKQPTLVHTQ